MDEQIACRLMYNLCPRCHFALPHEVLLDIVRDWGCPTDEGSYHNNAVLEVKKKQKLVFEEIHEHRLKQEQAEHKFHVVDCMITELKFRNRDLGLTD
jgi:hypothetical protein